MAKKVIEMEKKKRIDRIEEFLKNEKEGNLWISQGEYQKALSFFQKAIELGRELKIRRNELGGLLNNLGVCLYEIGKVKEAQEKFAEAKELTIGSRRVKALFNLALTYRDKSEAIKHDPIQENLIKEGVRYLNEAKKELNQLRREKEWKKLAEMIYLELGNFYFYSKEYPLATQYCQEALRLVGDNPTIKFNLALIKAEEEKVEEVIEILKPWLFDEGIEKTLRLKGIILLTEVYCQRSDHLSANTAYQKAKELAKRDYSLAKAIFNWARICLSTKNYPQATFWFKEGLKSWLGLEEVSLKETVEELEKLETNQIKEIKEVILRLAILLLDTKLEGEYPEVEKLLQISLKLEEASSERAIIFRALGDCQIRIAKLSEDLEEKQKRYKKAMEYLKKAEELGLEREKINFLMTEVSQTQKEIEKKLPSLVREIPPEVPAMVEKKRLEVPYEKKKKWIPKEKLREEKPKSLEEFTAEDIQLIIHEIEKEKEKRKIGNILKEIFDNDKPRIILKMVREVLPQFINKMAELKKREFSSQEIKNLKEELLTELKNMTAGKGRTDEIHIKLTGSQLQEYLEKAREVILKRIKKD